MLLPCASIIKLKKVLHKIFVIFIFADLIVTTPFPGHFIKIIRHCSSLFSSALLFVIKEKKDDFYFNIKNEILIFRYDYKTH